MNADAINRPYGSRTRVTQRVRKAAQHSRPDVEIKRLFKRFAALYGKAWTDQYATDAIITIAMKEWANSLSGYGQRRIKRAIDKAVRDYPDVPPLLPQFKKIIEQFSNPFDEPGFSRSPESKAIARETLAAINARTKLNRE